MTENICKSQENILGQALPFIKFYENRTVVIKYSGYIMDRTDLSKSFTRDIALLIKSNIIPIIVHGGGPQIGAMLKKIGIESKFENGLRITDRETVEVVEMVLAGSINKKIVSLINQAGIKAVGLCGKDCNMVFANKYKKNLINSLSKNIEKVDLGFVGEIVKIDPTIIDLLSKERIIPVIAPIASGLDGSTYNINADTFAGAIAGKLDAARLIFLTNVPGVIDRNGQLIKKLSIKEARDLIEDGTISGGMIPKIETSIKAIEKGAKGIAILDGKKYHSIILEMFTENGSGTLLEP
ncbi:acetylglutamate kinase [Candidatus Liberibacter americanus]|uniref:Acetylglutamate kinase n=1 Tax=Candidatus Liberibacter americanus str. Sao Paulo TaxID=1261131 RepID=U6B357_9HYPH|nr:acetylglutamate kinase [Candidatus Liberibacter americanus]AHA27494.1 Acetylglutamate kinase [Candidatus Liberibacter americanus str. Sao Paulo]EMS36544.1 acetylglutamate kinase [Candidatus Liberibacter americanus PW_SP]